MRELATRDRPREKLERAGAEALGDNELLALVIGHGTVQMTALAAANRLLIAAGGVHGLTRMHRDEMAQVPGVGSAVAARIMAAVELGRRTLTLSAPARAQLMSPEETAQLLLPQFGAHPVERFGIVLLDARHRLIRVQVLSSGSRDGSLVHPREVFREATLASASSIVLFHNHPSGDALPSATDIAITRRMLFAGHLMGIEVLDHLILADNRYSSMKQMGIF